MVEIRSRLSDQAARLKSKEDIPEDSLMTEYAPVYAASLVEMNEAFRTRILEAYDAEPRWDRIQKMISDNNALGENAAKLPYCLVQKLIYLLVIEQASWVCNFRYLRLDICAICATYTSYWRCNFLCISPI